MQTMDALYLNLVIGMQRKEMTIEATKSRVEKIINDPLASLILIVLHNAKATKSSKRMSLTELARRVGAHKWVVLRKIKGSKGHHALLRGFVHYPDKGRRKGFYLLKAGKLLAKTLATEQTITTSLISKIDTALSTRKTVSHRQVTPKSPSSHHQVTAESPLSHRFPIYPSTLESPLNPESLVPAQSATVHSSKDKTIDRTINDLSTDLSSKGCERCSKETISLKKASFTISHPLIIEYAPEAVRWKERYLCDTCYREIIKEVKQAWIKIARESNESEHQ